VAHELAAWIVTVHMIVALVIVQMLLYVTVRAFPAAHLRIRAPQHLSTFTIALIILTLVQIALGTQVRGGVDGALDAGVARNAALATVGTLDFLHRDAAFVVLLGSVLLVFWMVGRRAPLTLVRWSWLCLGLAVLQVALGVVMAYVTLLPAAQVLHLTVASLLLGAQTVLLLVAGQPANRPTPVGRDFSPAYPVESAD
jgi:cytochrome c oxidase assembly protein subunit 15